jgi:hypothetical protein
MAKLECSQLHDHRHARFAGFFFGCRVGLPVPLLVATKGTCGLVLCICEIFSSFRDIELLVQ